MKLELIIFGITGFLLYNTYYDGKIVKKLKDYKKHYQMALIGFVGLSLYIFLKRKPQNSPEMVKVARNFIKYMPIDRTTASMINPVFDFTMGNQGVQTGGGSMNSNLPNHANHRMMNSGKNPYASTGGKIKRSVSEPKKKFVASRQQWKCKDCKNLLDATYEIDHVIELQHGGSNEVDNLVALCRNCHGNKTLQSHL